MAAVLCSVPLLDWTGDKLSELVQDQRHIHPVNLLCVGAAKVLSSLARQDRSAAAAEQVHGRRPYSFAVLTHTHTGDLCHE